MPFFLRHQQVVVLVALTDWRLPFDSCTSKHPGTRFHNQTAALKKQGTCNKRQINGLVLHGLKNMTIPCIYAAETAPIPT